MRTPKPNNIVVAHKMVQEVDTPDAPSYLRCPISLELMSDPVTACTGITYDRSSIEQWLNQSKICPVTKQELGSQELIPNHALRRHIQSWCIISGVRRIPTPRIPPSVAEINQIVTCLRSEENVQENLKILHGMALENEKTRQLICSTSAPLVVASVFAKQCCNLPRTSEACETALRLGAVIQSGCERPFTTKWSLDGVSWVINNGSHEGICAAVFALKDVSDIVSREVLGEIKGLTTAMLNILVASRNPDSLFCRDTKVLKAALRVFYRVSRTKPGRFEAIKAGAVGLLFEMLADTSSLDRGVAELTLASLNSVLRCTEGRSEAYSHALAVPVLVKKLLRVSDLASEIAIEVLWTLSANCGDDKIHEEIVEAGGFQKLVMIVQLGELSEKSKHMTRELLKLLHHGYHGDCLQKSLAHHQPRSSIDSLL